MSEGFIPRHGGYKNLLSYQRSQWIYDATVRFCDRFVLRGDRTRDQMVQAARSGKQNIIEGSQVSGTSKELELKLTNVARASLEELLEDYRDFLRLRGVEEWGRDHAHARQLSNRLRLADCSYETLKGGLEHEDPSISANAILGLTKVTCYLLDQQIKQLEQAFVNEGGLREAMTRARLQARRKKDEGEVTEGT